EDGPDLLLADLGALLEEPAEDRAAGLDHLAVVVAEVADLHVVVPAHGAAVLVRRGEQGPEEPGLAHAAAAEGRHIHAALHRRAEVAEDEVVAVGVRKAPDLEDVAAARLLHREADERARDVAALHLVGAELLDLLLAGARLARARAGGE